GIPMAYVASGVPFDSQMLVLFLINFAWIVAYDTMYAMTDKDDDLLIGVKSTAIYFASYDLAIIASLFILLQSLWFYWATSIQAHLGFYGLWLVGVNLLIYQQYLISERIPQRCFKGFLASVYYGGIMWLAVIFA
ncbi:MAG: 4-hydroxybenzoate octaprenyltransferase, partial [Legionella sp.]